VYPNDVRTEVSRRQLPITPGYAYTDYRAQGQTLSCIIVDIGPPPSFELSPFNAYVALSRCRGRDGIRLLRPFDDALFTEHPLEDLRVEDERIRILDRATRGWWEHRTAKKHVGGGR